MMSNRSCPSYSRTSKSRALLGLLKYTARHSMLKMRLGAAPLVDVKMPLPAPSVRRSSQYGTMASSRMAAGRPAFAYVVGLLVNGKLVGQLVMWVVDGDGVGWRGSV